MAYSSWSSALGIGAPKMPVFDVDAYNAKMQADNAQNEFNAALPEQQAYQQMLANQQGILGNDQQRLSEVRNDPMDALFRDAVKKQLDTKGLESALFSQASDMNTAADANRQSTIQDQIARRGGSLSDPSAQAALAASTSQRQGDQQVAARNATLAGYQQGAQGLNAGLNYSGQRNNQLNTATNMVNQGLAMPITKAPGIQTSDQGSLYSGTQAANTAAGQAAKPTGVGFGTNTATPTYAQWLASQKKA